METTAVCGGLLRPAKFVEKHRDEGWTEGALRWQLFNASNNGLEAAGAIVRLGRSVFIDEVKFYGWLRARAGA